MSLNLEPKIIVSLMSGTSCDSIDVGLCKVNENFKCTLIDGLNYNFPNEIK